MHDAAIREARRWFMVMDGNSNLESGFAVLFALAEREIYRPKSRSTAKGGS